MPDRVDLYRLFIAAPSDVLAERDIVYQLVADWNAINSRFFGLAFEAVTWLTHSVPEDGARAQEILNRELVMTSDALVAIFWTRLGSPTGDSASGTVEEIERFRETGRPLALYFSDAPIPPSSVDEEQLSAVRAYRDNAFENGLRGTYEGVSEFRTLFRRYLDSLAQQVRGTRNLPEPIRHYLGACPEFDVPSDVIACRVRTSKPSFYTALQCVLTDMSPDDEVVSTDSISFARSSGISYWVTEGLQFLGFTHEAALRGVRFVRIFVVRRHEIERHQEALRCLCEMHNLAGVTTLIAPSETLPQECLYEAVLFGGRFADEVIYDLHGERRVDNYIYWGPDKVAACADRTNLLRSYSTLLPVKQKARAQTFAKVLTAAEKLRRELVSSESPT